MKIPFFLLPKSDVVYLYNTSTMRQALEKMEYHRYTAVPLIDHDGQYAGTITEGDLLWKLKSLRIISFEGTEKILVKDVPMRMKNLSVSINAEIEDLFPLVIAQNFVPVIDDDGIFIGIIRRREVIEYLAGLSIKAGPLKKQ